MRRITLKIFVASLTFVIGVAAATLWFIYRPSPSHLLTNLSSGFTPSEEIEEYAVYSALLKGAFVKDNVKLLVISDRTLFYANPDYLERTTAEERIQDMKNYYHSVGEETLRDFEAKHMRASVLRPNFSLPVKYALMDETKLERDEEGVGIGSFHKMYPDAGGMISLSKVGFNNDRDEAFVRVEYIFCPLCSHGGFVLLRKQWGVWRVVENFGGWAS
jgi:hypothetical protein